MRNIFNMDSGPALPQQEEYIEAPPEENSTSFLDEFGPPSPVGYSPASPDPEPDTPASPDPEPDSPASSEEKSCFFDAESYVNTPDIELAWADKAVEHMETHYNLITSVPPRLLKLTPHDDDIYKEFTTQFPDFKLDILDIESLKNEESKQKWRNFCQGFLETVEDAAFGTLLRIDSSKDYSEENTALVVRAQFLAIEIARNRLGLNDGLKKP